MKYEKIATEGIKEIYRVSFNNFQDSREFALVEVNKMEYINKAQLEYILKDESARQFKNFKTEINRR
jgi:hypothetical protein